MRTINDVQGDINFAHWHSKGNFIVAASKDTLVWMWNVEDGQFTTFGGHGAEVTCANFTPDGKRVVSCSEDCTLKVWNPKTGENIRTIKKSKGVKFHESPIVCMAIVGKSVVTGD